MIQELLFGRKIVYGGPNLKVDVVIDDEYVDVKHATIQRRPTLTGYDYFIKDEGSINGTYLVPMLGSPIRISFFYVKIPFGFSVKMGRTVLPWGNS